MGDHCDSCSRHLCRVTDVQKGKGFKNRKRQFPMRGLTAQLTVTSKYAFELKVNQLKLVYLHFYQYEPLF